MAPRSLPGVRALAGYRPSWLRRDLVAGIVLTHVAGPAGHGVRRAGRAAGDHGPVYDDPVPARLRGIRPVADSGAGAGLLARTDDRGHDPADPRLWRKSGARHRAGVDARADRRRDHDRGRGPEARVRRRPALQADADRLHERARADDPDRAAAQAVRLLDRRQRPDRRGTSVRGRAELGRCGRCGARDRAAQPGADPGAGAVAAARARRAGGGRRGDRGIIGVRSGRPRRVARRRPARGLSAADRAEPDLGSSVAGRGSVRDRARRARPTRSPPPRRSPRAPARRSMGTAR